MSSRVSRLRDIRGTDDLLITNRRMPVRTELHRYAGGRFHWHFCTQHLQAYARLRCGVSRIGHGSRMPCRFSIGTYCHPSDARLGSSQSWIEARLESLQAPPPSRVRVTAPRHPMDGTAGDDGCTKSDGYQQPSSPSTVP